MATVNLAKLIAVTIESLERALYVRYPDTYAEWTGRWRGLDTALRGLKVIDSDLDPEKWVHGKPAIGVANAAHWETTCCLCECEAEGLLKALDALGVIDFDPEDPGTGYDTWLETLRLMK